MNDQAHKFFKDLLETPSPSGYEKPVQDVVRAYAGEFADEVRTDTHGNVMAIKNADARPRLMFAGHCDQIGLIVQHIDDDGYLYLQPIGGWDPLQLIGQRLTAWTSDGPVHGVIARKPIHLLSDEERKQVPKMKDLWLDIGAKDKEEASGLVRVGDPVTLQLGYQELRNQRANSPGMDDKTGLWVVIEALRRAAAEGLNCGVYAVSTVQEEIGLRGARTSAYGIDPEVGIAVDVTHATDCPTIDKKAEGDIKLSGGPVIYRGPNNNPVVVDRLIEVAEKREIPYQLGAIGRATPTDANSLQVTRAGVATSLVSIPNRYMHSGVETISLEDIDRAADLLAGFALSLSESDDFRP
ncbi:MAG: M42 family peptidase [Planctomycetota bacterium]|nr:MAG: M42 family peptidase [Planctomycetota bacterium]REJ88968.1 MAG: M42 family peptidase [Planctomycetota bacterium]REK31216.1 MAG: M42 family peptidase [Planctomycetota bacterium]REK43554.1 MAG: M42 family peptidase [Planctomycetota bacterium]